MEGRRRLAGAFTIEINRIRPDPTQPRKKLESQTQAELTDSVRRLGILQPISVRYLEVDGIYQIISGERRYQAAIGAGLTEIPCWVQNPKDQEILVRQVSENWQRAELHPYELADALAQLRDTFQYSQKQLAEVTSKPESEISRLLSLLKVNPAVQRNARQDETGAITKRHLVALAQLPTEQQPAMFGKVQERNLTAQETERVVKEVKAKAVGKKQRGAPIGERVRFFTKNAIVTLAFRRQKVTKEDMLQAVAEAAEQIKRGV